LLAGPLCTEEVEKFNKNDIETGERLSAIVIRYRG